MPIVKVSSKKDNLPPIVKIGKKVFKVKVPKVYNQKRGQNCDELPHMYFFSF